MARPGYDEVLLLTGFPSLLGTRLLLHVLASEPRTFVYAVVRPSAVDQAAPILAQLPHDQRERVVMLEGDAACMDLGLSGAEFRLVTEQTDRIHHAAHHTYLGLDRREAERLNVEGAFEILDLAKACRSLQMLVFHSTTQVAGDHTGLVTEEDLELGQHFPTVIAETRARAEKIVRKAMRDLPIAVVRPSIIVGDSHTGEIDRFDGPYLFILLIVTSPPDLAIPLPGPGHAPLNLVPIDYVVGAAHALGRNPLSRGRTLHLVDPAPLSARRVFELVAQASGRPTPRGSVPTNLARALLRTPGLERFAKSPRAFVDLLTTDVRFDARHAQALLANAGIECPSFDSYVTPLVEFVRERVRERRESREAKPHDDTSQTSDTAQNVAPSPSIPAGNDESTTRSGDKR